MEIAPGQVVFSKAGRDADRKFIIIEVVDTLHVLISDGDLRKIEKPKKKKIKHLKITNEVYRPINEKLQNGLKVSNSEIRKALAVNGNER